MRATRARRLSAATARAAARARGSIAFAPTKSNALIMSMMSNATRESSGALPCRSPRLARDRGIQGSSEGRLAADQRLPGELEPVALAFRHELESLGADGQHVGLPLDRDFPPQRLFQFCSHGSLSAMIKPDIYLKEARLSLRSSST